MEFFFYTEPCKAKFSWPLIFSKFHWPVPCGQKKDLVDTAWTLVCTTQCFSKLQKEKEGKAETWLQLLGWRAQSLRAPIGSCEGLSQ